jgi:hypothetical protein
MYMQMCHDTLNSLIKLMEEDPGLCVGRNVTSIILCSSAGHLGDQTPCLRCCTQWIPFIKLLMLNFKKLIYYATLLYPQKLALNFVVSYRGFDILIRLKLKFYKL